MSRKIYLVVALWASTVLLSWQVHAQELRVGLPEFPPYLIEGKKAQHSGIWFELLKERMGELDEKPVFEFFPPARLIRNLMEGRSHVSLLAYRDVLKDYVFYGDDPVDIINLKAYRKLDRPPFGTVKQLRGKTVIVIRGFDYDGLTAELKKPENGVHVVEAANHYEAVRRLQNSHADYLINYQKPTDASFRQAKLDTREFRSDMIGSYPVFITVSKKAPEAAKLVEKLNDMFSRLRIRNRS